MNIPAINSEGMFIFSEPFNTLIPSDTEYKVVSVRNIEELVASGEDPFQTVYVSVNMTENDFLEDVKQDVPIVVFSTNGKELFYVPADRILTQPKKTGHTYVEEVMVIPLGTIPTDLNMEVALRNIKDVVKDTIGINSEIEIVKTSAVIQYSDEDHLLFMSALENTKTVRQSYKTMYEKLLVLYNKRGNLINKFETMFKNNICNK